MDAFFSQFWNYIDNKPSLNAPSLNIRWQIWHFLRFGLILLPSFYFTSRKNTVKKTINKIKTVGGIIVVGQPTNVNKIHHLRDPQLIQNGGREDAAIKIAINIIHEYFSWWNPRALWSHSWLLRAKPTSRVDRHKLLYTSIHTVSEVPTVTLADWLTSWLPKYWKALLCVRSDFFKN